MGLAESLKELLESWSVDLEWITHPPTKTCEEGARVRGAGLEMGLKSLLFKGKKEFFIVSLRADLKVDSRLVRKLVGSDRLRFATNEELWDLTQAVPGTLPPFGQELFGLRHFIDQSIHAHDQLIFNSGSLTESVILKTSDFLAKTKGNVLDSSLAKRDE